MNANNNIIIAHFALKLLHSAIKTIKLKVVSHRKLKEIKINICVSVDFKLDGISLASMYFGTKEIIYRIIDVHLSAQLNG
jgi:hypothetical protein